MNVALANIYFYVLLVCMPMYEIFFDDSLLTEVCFIDRVNRLYYVHGQVQSCSEWMKSVNLWNKCLLKILSILILIANMLYGLQMY